ncbi:DedA family protein [Microvirga sp. 2YAF29]|uniref:DedA family protein n=1 Tax=Microvirga sp. 2YAF29 TaxID=3233031 RepID=UPI003F981AB9
MSGIEPAIKAYGVSALFLTIYLESFGVPLPGESGLIAASLLAARGDLNIIHVFLVALLGGVLGDSTGYLIGRFGGRAFIQRFGWIVKLTPERLASLEKVAREKGFFMVLSARFVVVLRQLNGVLAGSIGMPWHEFVLANVIGAIAWAGLWTFGPYYFTDFFQKML